MTDPLALDSTSPRLGLPLLFAGQTQKEVFVNEALSVLDGVTHCAVEGLRAAPPAAPADGTAWLVDSPATGEWGGRDGALALRQAGQWFFVAPADGMQVLDRARRQILHRIAGAWVRPAPPPVPTGGAVIDVEARQALAALVAALQQWGVFSR